MSELTRCNYCTLADIKRRAKEGNKRVIQKWSKPGGVDVYVLPKDRKKYQHEEPPEASKVAWLAALTSHCVC